MSPIAASPTPGRGTLIFAVLVQQLIASLCYPIAKVGLAIIEPFTFAFYRYILSAIILLVVARFLRQKSNPVEKKDWPRIVLMGLLIIPFNQTLFLLGQSMTAAGHGAFLFSTTPVWILVLAMVLLKERPTARRIFGIVLAVSGVMVIMSTGAIVVGTEYLLGDLIIMVSVLAWAFYTTIGAPMVRKYGAWRMTAYSLSFGSLMYFPFGLYRALQYDYSQATPFAWFSVVYMAIGLSVIVYVIWYWLIKYIDTSRAAVFQNIQPIVASVVAYFYLGEGLGTGFLVGGAIVILGVLLSELGGNKKGAVALTTTPQQNV